MENNSIEKDNPMKNMGTIYVVIPAYNVEKFIGAAFESLLAQTYPHWKCLCMNDGSKDNTWAVMQSYARKDSRFIVFTHDNQGVTKTRNALLDKVKGPYLAFMDSDDYLHPQMFEVLLSQLISHQADMTECAVDRFVDNVESKKLALVRKDLVKPRVLEKINFWGVRSSLIGGWINVVNKLYRWDKIKDVRFSEGLSYEDDFFYSSQTHSLIQKKIIIDYPFYFYRKNPNSLCGSVNWDKYQRAGINRIRLSYDYFIGGNRVPSEQRDAFMYELTQDAYRMIVRKPLKKSKDRALFQNAVRAIQSYLSEGVIDRKYLSLKQRIHVWFLLHRSYHLSRLVARLT